jgi:transposase
MKTKQWMTARELAKMYGIGISTLYRLLKGPPKGYGRKSIDLRKIAEQRVGGRRRWSRSAAERLLQGAE